MALRGFESFLPYILDFFNNVKTANYKDLAKGIPLVMSLSDEDMSEKVSSRDEPKYINRINWSVTYLAKAELIQRVERGTYRITNDGIKALKSGEKIDLNYLSKIKSFREFSSKKNNQVSLKPIAIIRNELSPTEELFESFNKIKASTCEELLDKLQKIEPYQFEKIVAELISKMGYGGFATEPILTGGSGDKGIDAIIFEDTLGLGKIYIQAKRYASNNIVNHKIVREFVGALVLKGGNKGILITTSSFSSDAIKEKENSKNNIVLIDGKELASKLYDYGVGFNDDKVIKIMKIDNDYFE
jgi:restriction system protein